jgi:HD-GYP domain-containing protein (c-di-GMP phosphodiesterase class II)
LSVVSDILPLTLAGITLALLNLTITAQYLAIYLHKSLRTIWRVDLSFAWANYLGNILLGLLMAASYLALGVIGPALFFGPLLFSRWTMERFVQLREAYLDVVATLVNALDAKDSYTFGHSQRVAEGTIALGEYLKLSDKDMDTLYFSSILHDVGKIAIPDEILNKAGAFVLREYLIMQQHAPIGERILSHLRFLGPGIRWVGAHHERWDGQGFPDRIGGEEIPYGARLISVVDTYDAMTSDRPYRKGAEPTIAHQEIARAAGTQFDPRVAKAFLDMEKAELTDRLRAHLEQEVGKVEQVG